jgi:hypothetical protein
MPSWASPARKRVWAQKETKVKKSKNYVMAVYILQNPVVAKLARHRNDKDCQHSKSAPAPFLHCLPNKKILALFFPPPRMVQPF